MTNPTEPLVAAWAFCPTCSKGFLSERGVKTHLKVHKKEKEMSKKEPKAFPEQIFLKLETATNDDPYFVHYESAKEMAEPDQEIEVGVYRLSGTAKVTAPVAVQETEKP